jgi:hypothetical protein
LRNLCNFYSINGVEVTMMKEDRREKKEGGRRSVNVRDGPLL